MDKLYSKKFVCLVHVFLVNRVCNVLILLPIRIFLMSVCNVFTILQVKKNLVFVVQQQLRDSLKYPKNVWYRVVFRRNGYVKENPLYL